MGIINLLKRKTNKSTDIHENCDVKSMYEDMEPVVPEMAENIESLTQDELDKNIDLIESIIKTNRKGIIDLSNEIAQMPDYTEKEKDLRYKLIQKRNRFIDANDNLKNQLLSYKLAYHNKVGFRNPRTAKSLSEYALEDTTYWKFSQSREGLSYEKLFKEYKAGEIVEADDKECMLSFVKGRDLYKCWMYGDQITKFCFNKSNNAFKRIAGNKAYPQGNYLGEIKTDQLLVEKNFSLSDPYTVVMLITLCGKDMNRRVDAANRLFFIPEFRKRIDSLGFTETSRFLSFVKRISSEKDEGSYFTACNIEELYKIFMEGDNLTSDSLLDKNYKGDDIFLEYGSYILEISEGKGDNLDSDDIKNGCIDYFHLNVYPKNDCDIVNGIFPDSIGGGLMLRERLISDEMYGKTIREVIEEVFKNNSDDVYKDAFNLYSMGIPEKYRVLKA